MRETSVIFLLCIGMAMSDDVSSYKPRGWRPNGQYFNPHNDRLHTLYGPPGFETYKPSDTTTHRPQLITTTAQPTTPAPRKTTTTRTREPTTPSDVPEEDFNTNPALAIANSFAFNRPVYIYNSFPFLPNQVLLK